MNSETAGRNRETFVVVGSSTDQINVKISHRIIKLFSEGLYSSPNKAVEELVSNSFDAGACNVHIILSPDLRDPDATISVIDDGEGMDADDLKQHWVIGESVRRRDSGCRRRKPIGKFGIGKLSTYVLATKLTHRKLSITLRQYLLEIREQLRGLLDGIETLVLGRVDPDGSGWA